jgi:Transposase IS66 family
VRNLACHLRSIVLVSKTTRLRKHYVRPAAVPCAQALAIIGQLYGIEWAASDWQFDAPARQRVRQEQARPTLEKLQAYLQEQRTAALPKSPLAAALGYAAALLDCPDAVTRRTGGSRSTTTGRSRRYDCSYSAAKTGCSRGAKRRRTELPSCVCWCRPVSICRSIRLCICGHHRAGFDASGQARVGVDAARVEAAAGGRRCTVCCLNDSLLPAKPIVEPLGKLCTGLNGAAI